MRAEPAYGWTGFIKLCLCCYDIFGAVRVLSAVFFVELPAAFLPFFDEALALLFPEALLPSWGLEEDASGAEA